MELCSRTDGEPQFATIIKNRESWIDWVKVCLIFLVVVGHSSVNPQISLIIYSFHVPVFFIISGYLNRSYSIKKTIRRLLVPSILYALINFPYNYAYILYKGYDSGMNSIIPSFFKSFFMRGEFPLYAGSWFVLVLFYIKLLGGGKYWFPVSLFFLLILPSTGTFFDESLLHRALICMPFFCFGSLVKLDKWQFELNSILIICTFLFLLFVGGISNGHVDIADAELGNNSSHFILIAIMYFFVIRSIFSKFPSNRIIEVISEGSLLVLCIHKPIVDIFTQIVILLDPNGYVIPWVSGVFTMILSYYLIVICKKYCPVLIGK